MAPAIHNSSTGYGLGGPVGVLLGADHPERVGALIMYASIARTAWGRARC